MRLLQLGILPILAVLLLNFNLKPKEKPTLYTVGDSTVKNGSGKGEQGLWGWGDFIGQFLDSDKINMENHALGGTSSRSFHTRGLWEVVYNKLKKGDYVLIQFGHNDNGPINDSIRARGSIKGIGDQTEEIDNMLTKKHEIVHTYGWYICKMVQQAKEKGAIPILCSPIPRNDWKENKVIRNNQSYGLWSRQIAEKEKLAFVELNELMSIQMEKRGQAKVTGSYFYQKDPTHTTAKGALLAAEIISTELKKSAIGLRKYLLKSPKTSIPPKKKLFLIGDSTMASNDQAVGWGVEFPKYVDSTRLEVINKARGGRSSRSFEYEGLWKAVCEQLQPGNFVIIQFGHNDASEIDTGKFRGSLQGNSNESLQVSRGDSIVETVHTFGFYMEKFIREAKEKGAIPLVMSQTVRNKWVSGKVERRAESYNKWSKIAAQNQGVPFIDLNLLIAQKYEALGPEKVKAFFPKDHTHTNTEGANFNALTAAESIKTLKNYPLGDYMELPRPGQ